MGNIWTLFADVSGWFGKVLSIGGAEFQWLRKSGPPWWLGPGYWQNRSADAGKQGQQQDTGRAEQCMSHGCSQSGSGQALETSEKTTTERSAGRGRISVCPWGQGFREFPYQRRLPNRRREWGLQYR